MRYRKLTRTLTGACVLLALGLAACGGSDEETDSANANANAASGEKVTLTYWNGFTGGDAETYVQLIEEFNATHENIEIENVVQPWDSIAQKLPSALATGSGPDIATPDYNVGTIRQYIENGLVAPLDDLIGPGENQIAEGVLPQTIVDGFTVDGKLYAAPANFSTLMLYYNQDLYEKAGIEAPPETMDELKQVAVELTDKGKQYGLVLPDHATIPNWPILIWAAGGDVVDDQGCSQLAAPATVEAVESWAQLVREQGISPVGQTGQGADNLFSAGKAAMEINGPWAGAAFEEAGVNFAVAPVPVGESGEPVTLASTIPIVMSAKSEHKDAVRVFLSWFLGKEAQRTLAIGANYPPSRTDMADDPALEENPLVAEFAGQAESARLYLPNVEDFAKVDGDVFSQAIGAITRGEDAQSTLEEASEQMNEITGCTA